MNEKLKKILRGFVLPLILTGCAGSSLKGCWNSLKPDKGKLLVNASVLSTNEVLRLLNQGADVNMRSISTFGWTPLISAIYHRKEEVVDLLMARGADVNLGDAMNQTPIV